MTTSFSDYLCRTLSTESLMEVSDLWPVDRVNELFNKEITKLLQQHPDQAEDIRELGQINIVHYVDSALRRSGFQDHDLDELVQDILTKLLLGNFFKGYREGSLVGRFKVSVANAIKTLISKRARSRKRSSDLPDGIPASRPQDHDDVIREFRNWLRIRYGETAVKVFDHRLEGGDTADLIGLPGLETSYKVKQAVRDIKSGVAEYSTRDPDFFRTVQRAFESEKATINRRFPSRV